MFGLDIKDLSPIVDACHAQQFSYELCEAKKILISQNKELKLQGKLLDHKFIDVVIIAKNTQELCEKVENIIFKDSSICEFEDVNNKVIREFERIGPHSNNLLTLCLDSKILIEHLSLQKRVKERKIYLYLNFCVKIRELHSPIKD